MILQRMCLQRMMCFGKDSHQSAEGASTKPRQPSFELYIKERAVGLRLPCHTAYLPLLISRTWELTTCIFISSGTMSEVPSSSVSSTPRRGQVTVKESSSTTLIARYQLIILNYEKGDMGCLFKP
jgi:hypothetical protein